MTLGKEKHSISVEGIKCAYFAQGTGPTLIFLHGWAQSSETWISLTPFLSRYRLYCIDMPGFGESEPPPEPWDTAAYASFVTKVLDYLRIRECTIVGHSFGGRIAAQVAKTRKPRSLIIIASSGSPSFSLFRLLNTVLVRTTPGFAASYLYNLQSWLLTPRGYATKTAFTRMHSQMMLSTYLATHVPEPDLFSGIDCPALLIYGKSDYIAPPSRGIAIRNCLAYAQLVMIQKCGHFPHITNPVMTSKLISAFLEGSQIDQVSE